MNQGKNSTNSWTMNTKANLGLGQVAGNMNIFSTGVNVINDPECIDNPIIDNGLKSNLAPSIVEFI